MRDERQLALERDAALEIGWISRRFPPRGAEVNREQHGRAIEELVPTLVDLRRQVRALGVVLVGAQLRVMVQMPPGELACRYAAGNCVEEAENPLRHRAL